MPDPKLDYWTAVWNLAVDQHISSPVWLNSMGFLDLPERHQFYLEELLRIFQQLPDEAGTDIRILVEARQKHELAEIHKDWQDIEVSVRLKLEALARGESKTLKPNWEMPFEPPVSDDTIDEGDRITSRLPYADHLGEVMNRPRYAEDPGTLPEPRKTIPVPGDVQAGLQRDSRRITPLRPPGQTGFAEASSSSFEETDPLADSEDEWPDD